jgi:cell wall-associated NlpC family hydrolase
VVRLPPSLFRGTAVRALAIAIAVGFLASSIQAGTAAAAASSKSSSRSTSTSRQRDVERLQDQIDELNDELSALNEDALEAAEQLRASQREVATATAVLGDTQKSFNALAEAAKRGAVQQYIRPQISTVDLSASLQQNSRRQLYLRLAQGRTQDQLGALSAKTEDLQRDKSRADKLRKRAANQKRGIENARKRADQLIERQEKLLSSAQSDVVRLLAAEEERRLIAEAKAVAAAAKKREQAAKLKLAARQKEERIAAERVAAEAKRKKKLPRLAAAPTTSPVRALPRLESTPDASTPDEPTPDEPTTAELAAEAGVESGAPAAPGAETAVQVAMSQLGKSYVWGANGPVAFDCSGLTSYAWAKAGKQLPRTSRMQYTATRRVSRSELRPGDLLFFAKPGRPIHHVAMYIGNGQMVEAPHRKAKVRVRSMNRRDYVGAGRVG